MVVALFVIIGIAVVDRIFYTTFAFMNRAAVNKKLNINAPLINSDLSVVIAEGREIENSQPLAM
jgi:glycosylphosphatidylinositol transamidase (GPIT) subunit GPI8